MTEAINRPVLTRSRRGASEADEFAIGQSPDVILPATGSVTRESDIILPVEGSDVNDKLAELAFMEEPMTIYLEPNGEEEAASFADVAVNGKKAEVFYPEQNRWMAIGYLPVGVEIITKRKYVEVLARSKPQRIRTKVDDPRGDPRNVINRFTHSRYPFSVLEDKNPKGRAWLTKIRAEG
jgi:hypothetical protein